MKLVIRDTYDLVSEYVAEYVIKRINDFAPTAEKPFVLGLPTGSSPLGTYQRLVAAHKAGRISFRHVVTFNMDEYVGLERSHEQSYYHYMWVNFFQHIDILPENAHVLNGMAPDLQKECDDFDAAIERLGGVELFLGGVGHDGHIAFNEPGSSLTSRTRIKTLAYETVVANARFYGGDIRQVPKMALTVGVGTIMDSREVVIVVTGLSKALALRYAVEEGVNGMWTVSMLQMHKRATIVCDEDATNELRVKTVKYFKGIEKVALELDADRFHFGGVPRMNSGVPSPLDHHAFGH